MSAKDIHGKAYARFGKLKAGDYVVTDDGFTCMKEEVRKRVQEGKQGLFIACRCGGHYLDGQIDGRTDALVGLYPSKRRAS